MQVTIQAFHLALRAHRQPYLPGLPIKNFDAILYATPEEEKEKLVPELVITYGGHIVSKRLKEFLRKHPPKEHWHVSLDGEVADLFGSLTTVIEMDAFEFLEKIAYMLENRQIEYPKAWEYKSRNLPEPEFAYSEMAAIGGLIRSLPAESALHLGNSSTVVTRNCTPYPRRLRFVVTEVRAGSKALCLRPSDTPRPRKN